MVGIYFSGTGNSRYCVEKFLEEYEPQAEAFSIENENAALEIGGQAGLFGQRLYFFYKTKEYTDKLKIDADRCIGCGMCANLCPMENIQVKDKMAVPGKRISRRK